MLNIFEFESTANRHLKAYLEEQYKVDIVKKYGAYILLDDGVIVDFFYTLADLKDFLEERHDFHEMMLGYGYPPEAFAEDGRRHEETEEETLMEETTSSETTTEETTETKTEEVAAE